ncbi:MAG: endo-1,4-beta-xylanase [Planctomycetota bacterium]|jgi:GH35 family endo-1,4-beta-xylanase
MLQFAVYNETGPAQDWPLVNAHLVGPEDLPVRGTIEFRDGRLICRKRGSQTVGASVQFDVGRMGRLMLQTCLLPERDAPYLLSLELARHRIKMFIAKSEEWQMFDLSADHPAMALWEKAREQFIDAMTLGDPLACDAAARRSLILAVEATEWLALAHAEVLLHRRFAQRAASSSALGVRIRPDREGRALQDIVARDFDVVVLPVCWRDLEVEEGRYNWDPLDRWVRWAEKQKKPIVAGPLLDFSKGSLPDWMYVWQHDYDTCRDLAYDHLERVVQRYRASVGMWNVASGLNINENFRFTQEQMLDLVRMATLLVRQARRGGRTMVEIAQPFGEHVAGSRDSIHGLTFIDRLVQEGIRMDAVGVQVLFGQSTKGQSMRDLMQVSSLLDRFVYLEMPVVVSALGVPSEPVDPQAGHWRDGWSDESQVLWLSRIFGIAMSKPFVESVFWAELYDHDRAIVPGSGLIDERGRPKPSLARLIGVRKRLRKPLGTLKLPGRETPVVP